MPLILSKEIFLPRVREGDIATQERIEKPVILNESQSGIDAEFVTKVESGSAKVKESRV